MNIPRWISRFMLGTMGFVILVVLAVIGALVVWVWRSAF